MTYKRVFLFKGVGQSDIPDARTSCVTARIMTAGISHGWLARLTSALAIQREWVGWAAGAPDLAASFDNLDPGHPEFEL